MPTCTKCNKPVVKDIDLCQVCNSAFHPGCSRCYILTRGAKQCCVQAFSRSKSTKHIRSLSWPTNNLLAPIKSHFATSPAPGATPVVTMSNNTLTTFSDPLNLSNLPFSFNSLPPATSSSLPTSTVLHSLIPSASHPNPPPSASATGASQFSPSAAGLIAPVSALPLTSSLVNSVHSSQTSSISASTNQRIEDFQKLSLEDKFLESFKLQLFMVEQNSKRFSLLEDKLVGVTSLAKANENNILNIDSRLCSAQADIDKIKAFSPISLVPPRESTAEVSISGIPSAMINAQDKAVSLVLTHIKADRFINDIISIKTHKPTKRLPSPNWPVPTPSAQEPSTSRHPPLNPSVLAGPNYLTFRIAFKSSIVRNEILKLKIDLGEIRTVSVFPDCAPAQTSKIYINEWLDQDTFELFRQTRDVAREKGYERVWHTQERIYVKKMANAERISINCKADLLGLS